MNHKTNLQQNQISKFQVWHAAIITNCGPAVQSPALLFCGCGDVSRQGGSNVSASQNNKSLGKGFLTLSEFGSCVQAQEKRFMTTYPLSKPQRHFGSPGLRWPSPVPVCYKTLVFSALAPLAPMKRQETSTLEVFRLFSITKLYLN